MWSGMSETIVSKRALLVEWNDWIVTDQEGGL